MTSTENVWVAVIVAICMIWIIAYVIWSRKPDAPLSSAAPVLRDWLPTGHVNMVARHPGSELADDDAPTDFLMLIEENRLVSDISGMGNVEIRWRKPTRNEARVIVRTYHQFMSDKYVPHERLQKSPFGQAAPSGTAQFLHPELQDRLDALAEAAVKSP